MKPLRFNNIIFDFDGTLANTASLITASMQAAVREMLLPEVSVEECRRMIGIRLDDMPPLLWPGREVDTQRYVDTYRKNFEVLKSSFPVEAFPGVVKTLRDLKKRGFKMAIATSRSVSSLEKFLEDLEITDCFEMLVGGESVTDAKPSPEPVFLILETLGWKAEETLVVGDMPVDMMMGHAAGCKTVGVTYGNGTSGELEASGADYIFWSFPRLTSIL